VLTACARQHAHVEPHHAVSPDASSPNAVDVGGLVDDYATRMLAKYQIPGLALAVVRDGRVSAMRAYGVNDLELSTPATPDTVFQLASASKPFAGIATMLLVEDGRLTPHTLVDELLPSLPASWRGMRVHHLLEHTSGLPGGAESNARFVEEMRRRRNRGQFVDAAKLDYFTGAERVEYLGELPLASAPGEKYSYNQPAYMLVGMIVERLAGRPYETFLRERVFTPLAMSSATFGDSRVVVPGRRQVAYTRQYGPLQNWLWPYSTTDYPAA
jgi:CubicO group peptidase (beta-lactamase class C family)